MNDTIAALSTPQGESAIALVRLSGADCEKIAQEIFSKKSNIFYIAIQQK